MREGGRDIDLTSTIQELETEMLKAAEDLKFEKAALLRDQIKELKHMMDGTKSGSEAGELQEDATGNQTIVNFGQNLTVKCHLQDNT